MQKLSGHVSPGTLALVTKVLSCAHNPAAAASEGHVYRIWEDGEVTMTKSGSLLNQRNEHMQEAGMIDPPLPLDVFPATMGSHSFVFLDGAEAFKVLGFVLTLLESDGVNVGRERPAWLRTPARADT